MKKNDGYDARSIGDAWMAAVAIVIATIGGCAIFAAPVAERIASGVEKYCDEPYTFRQVYANTVNSQLLGSGHQVHIHCMGDPPATP